MELRDYIRIVRMHWLGIVLIVAAVVAVAGLYTVSQPKVYAADTRGFVTTDADPNPALASVSDDFAKSRATSYVDLATSRAVAQLVIKDLDLDDSPAALVGRISAEQPTDTVWIKITAHGSTPTQAQELADSWVHALAKQVSLLEDPDRRGLDGVPVLVPVESAELPTTPVSPNPVRNVMLAVAVGLLLGFGYAMVRHTLDRRLRTVSQVEQRSGLSVIGTVPMESALGHAPGERAEIVLEDPRVAGDNLRREAGEAFRMIRTNLLYMNVDSPPRTIVVTSPRAGDGKSTVAANLAAAIAASNEQAVLIDADLRRPSVASSLGLVGTVGLTDVLAGRISVDEALQQVPGHPGLSVLAAGFIPPNPSEMLGSEAMRTMMADLARGAIVIIDAPPLLPVTDAAVLSASVDGALVVISAGKTVDAELAAALSKLRAIAGRPLGVILNKTPRRGPESDYYGGGYGYYASQVSVDPPAQPASQ